jgi:hypothetical protein
MFRKIFTCTAVFFLLSPFSPSQAETIKTDITVGATPVIVELFTAQGCPSCPGADNILGQLAQHPRIFALSCHVTYWDTPAWKDTLGRDFCTQRQSGYVRTKGSKNYYTPQMVINGGAEFPGNQADAIKQSIESAAHRPVQPISLSRRNAHTLVIGLPHINVSEPVTLWMFGYRAQHTEAIAGGSNKGKNMTYHNTILMMDSIGTWQGTSEMRRLDIGNPTGIDGIVMVAQSRGGYGPILAAGRIEF